MADPLIVDPALVASVVRQFNLRGEMSPFILTNRVIPTFDIGKLVSATVPTVVTTTEGAQGVRVGSASGFALAVAPPNPNTFVVDGGFQVNPGAAAVLVDSGALSEGNRVIKAYLNANAIYDVIVELRNAANTANVKTWSLLVGGVVTPNMVVFEEAIAFAASERVRVVTGGAVVGTISSTIAGTSYTYGLAS